MEMDVKPTVERMFQCAQLCLEPRTAATSGNERGRSLPMETFGVFYVKGDDLLTPIPFVPATREKEPTQAIDVLFLDTVHNGDQLLMELLRFSRHVRKQILFHDTQSFANTDEAPQLTASNFPIGKLERPTGLWSAIRMFLSNTSYGLEWEEEMNFIHNNGLYVLRRKSTLPSLPRKVKPLPFLYRDTAEEEMNLYERFGNEPAPSTPDSSSWYRFYSPCEAALRSLFRLQNQSYDNHDGPNACRPDPSCTAMTPYYHAYTEFLRGPPLASPTLQSS